MYNKRYLDLHCERIILLVKALKINAFIPVMFINIIIPLINLAVFLKNGTNEYFITNVNRMNQLFIPFLSCWWVIFIMQLYYEDKGSEILFVNKDKYNIYDIFLLFLTNLINITLMSIPYFFIIEKYFVSFIRIILVCFFYLGITVFTTTLLKSITPTLLLIILYFLSNIISPFPETLFPFYYTPEISPNILFCEIPLAILGVMFLAMTKILRKNTKTF